MRDGGAAMRFFRILWILCFGAFAGFVSAPASAQQITWRLTTASPSDDSTVQSLRDFAAAIEQRTNGRMRIRLFPNSALGNDIKDQVRSGAAEMGELSLAVYGSESRLFAVDAIPFLARNFAEARTLYQASRSELRQTLGGQGLMLLFAAPADPQGVFSARAIGSLGDMKGLTWRANDQVTKEFADRIGASSRSMAFDEARQMLARGSNGSVIASPKVGGAAGLARIASHFCATPARIPKTAIVIGKRAFDVLDAGTQKIILDAAASFEAMAWDARERRYKEDLAAIKEGGMNVSELSSSSQDDLRTISQRILKAYCPECIGDGGCTHPKVVCKTDPKLCCDP